MIGMKVRQKRGKNGMKTKYRTGSNGFNRPLWTRLLSLSLGFSLALFQVPSVQAKMDSTYDPNRVNGNALPNRTLGDGDCQRTCKIVKSYPGDQWCADHGQVNNPAQFPGTPSNNQGFTNVQTTPGGGTTTATTNCPYPIISGVDKSCAEVQTKMLSCKFKNTQIESYCSAYSASQTSANDEKLVLPLDFVAASTCGLACAMSFGSGFSLPGGLNGVHPD